MKYDLMKKKQRGIGNPPVFENRKELNFESSFL